MTQISDKGLPKEDGSATRLTAKNLPDKIRSYAYDRDAVDIGIVHFGIGNFHRAHQAVYVEDLLESGDLQWGIAGVSMRSASVKNALEPQDYVYTLAVLGERKEYRLMGAIKDIVVAPEDPQAVVDLVAKPTTQLVSSTITEKGYCLSSGRVDLDHPSLVDELKTLEEPTTIYGFIASGLIQRFEQDTTSKLSILCCDNISAGGELLAEGVGHLLKHHNPEVLEWSRNHVGYLSSMVDRVSPATNDQLRDVVATDIGRHDAAPVSTEPFSQWIIEDGFIGVRPSLDQVGVVFDANLAPFEQMKLRYLNAAHSIASTVGYLTGDRYVHEALSRQDVFRLMRQTLYNNVLPHASVPDGYDAATYIEDVIKRFQNSQLPYANLQVGTDSSQKIQQRWFPTIDVALKNDADCSYFAFCLGAWVVFIARALENDVLNDPKKAEFADVSSQDGDSQVDGQSPTSGQVKRYLEIANADSFAFSRRESFIGSVVKYAQDIQSSGIETSLSLFLDARNSQQA